MIQKKAMQSNKTFEVLEVATLCIVLEKNCQ